MPERVTNAVMAFLRFLAPQKREAVKVVMKKNGWLIRKKDKWIKPDKIQCQVTMETKVNLYGFCGN